MEIGENNNEIKEKEIKLSGLVISSLLCQNNNQIIYCFFKEYKDEIDETSFSRNEECNHYHIRMGRKIINKKVKISVTFECKICANSETKDSDNVENIFEFECCGQNKIKFTYYISLIEDNKKLIDNSDDSLNKNDINNYIDSSLNNINNNNDNSFYNLIDNDVNIKIVNVHPWPHIADDDKITIRFKYYKKTNVNYHIHCSKANYFSEVMKEFIKASEIRDNFKISICNGKKLDGENIIKELELKDYDLVLVR